MVTLDRALVGAWSATEVVPGQAAGLFPPRRHSAVRSLGVDAERQVRRVALSRVINEWGGRKAIARAEWPTPSAVAPPYEVQIPQDRSLCLGWR